MPLSTQANPVREKSYDLAPFRFEPGTTWAYNSFHLQVAGAMAAYAAGISVQELLHRYLIGPLQLKATTWLGGTNPGLAGNLMTTGDDYDRILRAYVGNELIPEEVSKEMEKDYLKWSANRRFKHRPGSATWALFHVQLLRVLSTESEQLH